MRYLLVLFFYLITSPVFAVYDLVAIDIIPSEKDIKFCFHLDATESEMYLAMTENHQDFWFFDEQLALTPLQSDTIPRFLQKKFRASCFGPYSNETLQNLKLYVGAGDSFDDVLENQKYLQFFDGFPTLTDDEKPWTVLVYIVGSDLERRNRNTPGHASKDILEMLAGSRQANNVNVVIATGGSSRTGWDTVKRSLIRNGQRYILEDLGPQNMAEPQILSDFVNWATTQFPAQHYALIFWNHGGGTLGIGKDTSEPIDRDMMNLNQLHQAYQTIREHKPLDIVVYDACLMSTIEVAEVTATVANAMAASAELEPAHGIDYAHLLSHSNQNPPADGSTFGRLVKTGYIQQTKDKGNFDSSQITYTVLDLTQLPSFTEEFNTFALEFKKVLETPTFTDYKTLSHGIIRAPGYPVLETGRLSSLRSTTDNQHIRIDLYNLLQTIGPDFDEFSASADQLLTLLDQMIVDYEANDKVKLIDAEAGRISLDINIVETRHLATLPAAYTLLNDGLKLYNERRQQDGLIPDGQLVCPEGKICAFARWLDLPADQILGIEAYFGQQVVDNETIYLIDKGFYQSSGELTEPLELGVDGNKACQYQLCVNQANCENITLTEQGDQLLADVSLNESPAIMTFCPTANETLAVCNVVQQTNGIWGRGDNLYPEDQIVPNTLQIKNNDAELQVGNALTVDNPANVNLQKNCNVETGAIWAMYYGLNRIKALEKLCDKGDCICQPDDEDSGCQRLGVKSGVYLN
ncbi:clostripain [Beggiatoa sp. PS]|nr:clostripain [Beggiatoa sp. PS]